MLRTFVAAGVAAVVALVAIGGCADPRPGDPGAISPSPTASSSPTDGPGSTTTAAQEAVGAFVSAAQILDADIAQTGLLLNGLFVTDGVRYVDSVTVAAMATLERVKDAATLIPAGLADEVRVAALQVYHDLLHRAYTLSYVPGFIYSGLTALEHPTEVWAPAQDEQELADLARSLLAFGGMSKARFADDLAALQDLAAGSGQPAMPVPPPSPVAGLLAFEIASMEIGIQGCNPPPYAPIPVTSMEAEWRSVEIGPIEIGSTAVQAYFDPLDGWQIVFPYC